MKTFHAGSVTVRILTWWIPPLCNNLLPVHNEQWPGMGKKRKEHETVVLQTPNQEVFMWQIKATAIIQLLLTKLSYNELIISNDLPLLQYYLLLI